MFLWGLFSKPVTSRNVQSTNSKLWLQVSVGKGKASTAARLCASILFFSLHFLPSVHANCVWLWVYRGEKCSSPFCSEVTEYSTEWGQLLMMAGKRGKEGRGSSVDVLSHNGFLREKRGSEPLQSQKLRDIIPQKRQKWIHMAQTELWVMLSFISTSCWR